MKSIAILMLTAMTLGMPAATSAFAETTAAAALTTATFDVPGMYCELCPVTVKRAMSGVAGVKSVETSLETRSAVVVFDPAVTDIAAIAKASEEAGYPAQIKG